MENRLAMLENQIDETELKDCHKAIQIYVRVMNSAKLPTVLTCLLIILAFFSNTLRFFVEKDRSSTFFQMAFILFATGFTSFFFDMWMRKYSLPPLVASDSYLVQIWKILNVRMPKYVTFLYPTMWFALMGHVTCTPVKILAMLVDVILTFFLLLGGYFEAEETMLREVNAQK